MARPLREGLFFAASLTNNVEGKCHVGNIHFTQKVVEGTRKENTKSKEIMRRNIYIHIYIRTVQGLIFHYAAEL